METVSPNQVTLAHYSTSKDFVDAVFNPDLRLSTPTYGPEPPRRVYAVPPVEEIIFRNEKGICMNMTYDDIKYIKEVMVPQMHMLMQENEELRDRLDRIEQGIKAPKPAQGSFYDEHTYPNYKNNEWLASHTKHEE